MEIGRKIYFELATGNLILDTGERSGDVIEKTLAQDFESYSALQPYQQSAVGVVQLAFGQFADNFAKYPFHVDITKNPIDETAIVWDIANPYGATLPEVQAAKLVQIKDLYSQKLNEGFPSSVTGVRLIYDYTPESQILWKDLFDGIADNLLPDTLFPMTITIKDGTDVPHEKAQISAIKADIAAWKLPIYQTYQRYNAQVRACASVDEVNAIAVTF